MSQSKDSSKIKIVGTPLTGIIKRHPDGFGFFIPDERGIPDIYISRTGMTGVMTNDKVEVIAKLDRREGRYRGSITKVIRRAQQRVTGRLHKTHPDRGFLSDESHGWGEELRVSFKPTVEVEDSDWVTVLITSFPGSPRGFAGEIEGVIGDYLDPLNDAKRVLFSNGIVIDFPESVIRQAKSFSDKVDEKDFSDRKDLRDLKFITIDGQTAKDFDDAVYVEMVGRGFNLKVAIADVSHYVTEGSPIDEEATKRGTSTYFPHFVVPMLPEALSNELCSLKPRVPRLAMVADMVIDFSGEMIKSEFYEAVIESHARVTYGEAQEVVDGSTPKKFAHVEHNIKMASDLAKILMAKRNQRGSLSLEVPETVIELDETGQPIDIMPSERLFAHKLIEELMLAANVAVAEFFIKKDVPALYRVHESPKTEKIQILQGFLETFGFENKISGGGLQKKISKALAYFSGQPQEHILNILTLRSMTQAKYSPDNLGHFGLGYKNYSHFTSPIRRYPDLIVHRILKAIVVPNKGYRKMKHDDLLTAGEMLSACEQRSVKSERQFNSIKKARFIEQFVGEEFSGMISSVARFGAFVVLRQFDVDGLVRIEDLPGDNYVFDEENLRLVGKKSGHSYCLGDELKVQVVAADPQHGRIDFSVAKGAKVPKGDRAPKGKTAKGAAKKTTKSNKKRGKAKKNSRRVRKARAARRGGKG